MWTLAFWKATAERAVKTFAQSLLAVMAADGFGLLNADWVARLSAAGMAAVLSVLSSLASSGVNGPGPSLGAEVTKETP